MTNRSITASSGEVQQSMTRRVCEGLTDLLPTGKCSIVEISKEFQIDRRSVSRHLKSEGTTYVALLNSVRRSLLRAHIKLGECSLTEIAPPLGFSSLSALSKWRRKHLEQSWFSDLKQIEPGFWMSDTHYVFEIQISKPARRSPKPSPKRSNTHAR